jgi:hypothetical protein
MAPPSKAVRVWIAHAKWISIRDPGKQAFSSAVRDAIVNRSSQVEYHI